MPQQLSPFLEGKYGWNYGEAGWNTGMDENLLKFSFMFDRNVDSITASLPAAVNGQAHYLTTDNRIYFAVGTSYYSTPVPKNFILFVRATGDSYQFNGTTLVQIDSPSQTDARIDSIEVTLSSLGTAAFEDIEFFATQAELDVVSAQSNQYTDNSLIEVKGTVVTPERFGAIGDGIADDTLALQAALSSDVKTIDGQGKTYKVSSTLQLSSSKVVQNLTIDASTMSTNTTVLKVFGQVSTTYTPLSTLPVGGDTVTLSVSDAANFAKNDYLRYRANNVFDSFNTNSKVGEIVVVKSVDYATGVITCKTKRLSAYTTGRIVEKITPVMDARLSKIYFKGVDSDQNGQVAVEVSYGNGVLIDNCRFERFDSRCVYLLDCVGCNVRNSVFRSSRPSTSGYGVSFADATQDCCASGNYFEDIRHSLSTNNTSARGGIPRRLIFTENRCYTSASALGGSEGGGDAIDTHGAAESIIISNNTVIGSTGSGINVECSGATITNNRIINSGSNGIFVHNESDFPGKFIISGNTVNSTGSNGIVVSGAIRGSTVIDKSFVINNNLVTTAGTTAISIGSSSTPMCYNISVIGNTIESPTNRAISVVNCRGISLSGNSVENSGLGDNALRITDTLQFTITANAFRASPSTTVPILNIVATAASSTSRGIISSNVVETSTGTTTSPAVLLDGNVSYVGVFNNVTRGTTGISVGAGTGNTQANNVV